MVLPGTVLSSVPDCKISKKINNNTYFQKNMMSPIIIGKRMQVFFFFPLLTKRILHCDREIYLCFGLAGYE
jgi:hypothetical protein